MGTLHTDVLLQQAQRAFAANRIGKARRLCEELLGQDANNAEAVATLGQIAFAQSRFEEAASYMLRAIELQPQAALPYLILGEIRTFQGRYDEAITEYDKVLKLDPQHPTAVGGKADTYEKSGRRDKARALLRPFVQAGRETPQQAVIQARLDLHDRNYDAVIDLINRQLDRGEATDYLLRHLLHQLGQALERTGRFDDAFAAYDRANQVIPTHFDRAAWTQAIDDTIEAFTPQRFAAVPRAAHGSPLPVFVVGMPRSGSTLVETILDAHPDVAAAGELPAMQHLIDSISLDIGSTLPYPACIEDLDQTDVDTVAGRYLDLLRQTDGQARRIVDKYLNNYRHLGMLAVLFPQARIIHCRRHPLDTCLSCLATTLLPAPHPYSCDLGNLGVAHVAYERLMSHWRDVLKIPMLEIRYEALVADQERVTRQIIEYCGLDFDERCLRFYESDRIVLTASYDQVNRPVYSSSVGRYRNFQQHLGPLKAALAEGGWTDAALERWADTGEPQRTP